MCAVMLMRALLRVDGWSDIDGSLYPDADNDAEAELWEEGEEGDEGGGNVKFARIVGSWVVGSGFLWE